MGMTETSHDEIESSSARGTSGSKVEEPKPEVEEESTSANEDIARQWCPQTSLITILAKCHRPDHY